METAQECLRRHGITKEVCFRGIESMDMRYLSWVEKVAQEKKRQESSDEPKWNEMKAILLGWIREYTEDCQKRNRSH